MTGRGLSTACFSRSSGPRREHRQAHPMSLSSFSIAVRIDVADHLNRARVGRPSTMRFGLAAAKPACRQIRRKNPPLPAKPAAGAWPR